MIKVSELKKKYGNLQVLDKVGFEIESGEVVGLVGPNGAGKTTTMRILTGFLPYEEGEVEINGYDMQKENEKLQAKAQIGYLPENNPMYANLLVKEYLEYLCQLKEIVEQEKEIKRVVKSAGLESVYWRPIGELSKGFRQRVGLAGSILGDPKVLVLDEPTEGLDPNQRVDIRNLVAELGKNKTVIISSHVLSEVEHMCSRIMVISSGKLVADGKTEEILSKDSDVRVIDLELEGNGVKSKIKKIVGEENLIEMEEKANHIKIRFKFNKDKEIRPDISQAVAENGWIIWQLKESTSQLEDVFRDLTK